MGYFGPTMIIDHDDDHDNDDYTDVEANYN